MKAGGPGRRAAINADTVSAAGARLLFFDLFTRRGCSAGALSAGAMVVPTGASLVY